MRQLPGSHAILRVKEKVKVVQLCLTLCDPTDYTVHEILQVRILEWASFPGDLPNPGIEPRSAALQGDPLPAEPPGETDLDGKKSIYLQQFCTHIIILFFTFNTVFKKLH